MAGGDQDQDGGLGPFARDAAATLDARSAGVKPDFAAMMARARAISEAFESQPSAPVIPLIAGQEDDEEGADPGLAPFTASLRAELDARLDQRRLAGIPPLHAPVAGPRRRVGAALLGLLAAAAAVLLLIGGSRLAGRMDGDERGLAANAAGQTAATGGATHAVVTPAPVRPVAPAGPVDSGGAAVPEDRDGAAVPEDRDGPAVPEDRGGAAVPEDSKPRKRRVTPTPTPTAPPPTPTPVTPTPTLEEEAQALWQRGELAAAEAKYREILRVAGVGRRAELAYGDLFALTRQMRGADGQARVWQEYLAAYPRGRFAEDARGGTCQRAPADEQAACWRTYLEHHPDGAHRAQAEAAQGAAP